MVKIPGEAARSNLAINQPDGPFTTFTFDFPCGCQSGLGRRFVAPGGNVKIQILPFLADFTSEIRLLVRGQSRTLATNRDVGQVIDLGRFAAGTELIFYIHVRDTNRNFFMGSASRNEDGLAHARLVNALVVEGPTSSSKISSAVETAIMMMRSSKSLPAPDAPRGLK